MPTRTTKKTAKAKDATRKKAQAAPKKAASGHAKVLGSRIVYEGPLFRVQRDTVFEPGTVRTTGRRYERDVIRHNGSTVILAADTSKRKKDPWIVMVRQYRHAARQFLWELPAGKLEAGEDPLTGAQRELAEETGYRAKKWRPLVEYYPSPGFLGEDMKLFLAEGLTPGSTHWDEDEEIDLALVKLSDLLRMIEKGEIHDGKTLNGVLLYARLLGRSRKS